MMDCGIERRFKGDYQAIFAVEAWENPCRARQIYRNPVWVVNLTLKIPNFLKRLGILYLSL